MNSNLNMQTQVNVQGGGNQFDIFNYNNLGQVRVQVDQYGNPWFCLVDICKILNLQPNKVLERLNPYGRNSIPVIDNLGRTQEATFVDQGNLFMTIGRSRKPEAKVFMDWVYREVLPSIANRGYYAMPQMTEMQMINKISATMIDYGNRLDDHDTQLKVVNSTLEQFNNQIEILSHEGYFTIATHARFRNIPISLETAQTLGTIATKICEERGIGVASIPHPTYTFIHAYPYEILNEVFSNYFSN